MSRAGGAMGLALALFAFAACQGEGSDIGPRFAPLPSVSSKVNVYDDQNRGVVGARVGVVNSAIATVTGRNGRGDLLANPTGRQLVRIDGTSAAAVAGDRLAAMNVGITLPGGDFPAVFHLPDSSATVATTINVGTQMTPTGFAHPAANGGSSTIPVGTSVGVPGTAATVDVRTGTLQSHHLPGDIPTGVLMSRGLYVDPPDVMFTPGANTSVLNDLLATGAVSFYRLDDATGAWVSIANATVGGGIIQASGSITQGGLYAFGVAVTTGVVRGRVIDAQGNAVRDTLVNIDGRRARTDGGGRFVVQDVPAVAGDGSPRTATIELFAGGSWLPVIATSMVAMNGTATVDVGDITLDTLPAGNFRIQQVLRARPEPTRSCRLSSLFGSVAVATVSDTNGQAIFEDVPSQWFGFQGGFPKDNTFAYYSQAVGFSEIGRRWLDAFQFFDESAWFIGSRNSRVIAVDSIGGGPLFEAVIVRGAVDGSGFVSRTREAGIVFAERSFESRATATYHSARDGKSITHAFSIDTPNGEHLEMPIQQVLRTPLGAFDRHGLVAGAITNASPMAFQRLRVTRRIEIEEWWDDVVEGIAIPSSLPIDVDPATTFGAFQAGVDKGGGHLAVAELDPFGVMQRIGLATEVVPTEAETIQRDITLDHVADMTFPADGVLNALDIDISAASLMVSLALVQPVGGAVDVVRGLTGNHTASGADLSLTLPPLSGDLAGHSWFALVEGSGTNAGRTVTQKSLLKYHADGSASTPQLPSVPTITQPAAGSTVLGTGFTVQFTLPHGVMYAVLELRSTSGGETLLWQAVLPPNATEFRFARLPTEAQTPLVSGKTYSLTLTAYKSTTMGPFVISNNPYGDMTTYWQSIGAVERGVDALSSVMIQVTSL